MKDYYRPAALVLISVWLMSSLFGVLTGLRLSAERQLAETLQARFSAIREQELGARQLVKKNHAVVLLFVGDIMLNRGVGSQIKTNNDAVYPFRFVAEEIRKADLAFGNLESPISGRGRNQGSIYSFRADPMVVGGLKFAGFDVLSLANNHIWDWGREALEDTIVLLKEAGIFPVGAGRNEMEANEPVVRDIKGKKIAFLAYTDRYPSGLWAKDNYPGISRFDLDEVVGRIRNLKPVVDFVVVSMHWGDEYESQANETQKFIGRRLIDAGADLVIGHHPHVVQQIEYYKDGVIAYSLGNFIFDQNFSEETMAGLALRLEIGEKNIVKIIPLQVKISPTFQPSFVLE